MGSVKTDRKIQGSGTSPDHWQSWLHSQGIAGLATSTSGRRLVVVAPHPDDELLTCGSMLAAHAVCGGEWRIVAVTDGEASHGSTVDTCELAQRRRCEREAGLKVLGLSMPNERILRLGMADGTVKRMQTELSKTLLDMLQPDDIVVSTWRFDGHPDHEATGVATALACEMRGCVLFEAPVWMWHWATPGHTQVPWHRLRQFEVGSDLSSCKQIALSTHVSQLEGRPNSQGPVLDAHILAQAAWPVEYFFV